MTVLSLDNHFFNKKCSYDDILKYLYSIDKKQRFSTYWSFAYIVYLLAFFE